MDSIYDNPNKRELITRTFSDIDGDHITVENGLWTDAVYVEIDHDNGPSAGVALTPKKARKLAKALKRAARVVEGTL